MKTPGRFRKACIGGLISLVGIAAPVSCTQDNTDNNFKPTSGSLCYPEHNIVNPETKKLDFGYLCRSNSEIYSISLVDKEGKRVVLAEDINNESHSGVFPDSLPCGVYTFSLKKANGEKAELNRVRFFIDVKNKEYRDVSLESAR